MRGMSIRICGQARLHLQPGLPPCGGCSVPPLAAAAVVDAAAVTVIDQQENDDDEQDPSAVVTAEQITQAHTFHLLTRS